jgi:hypothetical protein
MNRSIGRRHLAGLVAGATIASSRPALADKGWHDINISGISPPLQMLMTRANDGKPGDPGRLPR